jgi:hypothetical protein
MGQQKTSGQCELGEVVDELTLCVVGVNSVAPPGWPVIPIKRCIMQNLGGTAVKAVLTF